MKYDREWLQVIADAKKLVEYLQGDLIPLVPIEHRFPISQATKAVAEDLRRSIDHGLGVSHAADSLSQLVCLAGDLIEERRYQCAASSSQAPATS